MFRNQVSHWPVVAVLIVRQSWDKGASHRILQDYLYLRPGIQNSKYGCPNYSLIHESLSPLYSIRLNGIYGQSNGHLA